MQNYQEHIDFIESRLKRNFVEFYIIKPLHYSECKEAKRLGTCSAGFLGIGYLDVSREALEITKSSFMHIGEKKEELHPEELYYFKDVALLLKEYKSRIKFIERYS